jgi:hypothetical protein
LLEITNKTKGPIQILVKSTQGSYNKKQQACVNTTRAFKSLNIPGIGGGLNVITIPDEKMTDHIKQLEAKKLIKIRHV